MGKQTWWDDYQSLNLCGGTISFILEDDEDMIEINYADGMLIDIGKPMSINKYCITVVLSNDELGWKNPIMEITVDNKEDLIWKIQETIFKVRQL